MTQEMYGEYLTGQGKNLSEVRRYNSAMITNSLFDGDVGYKQVYLLDPKEGWKWTEVKYSKHSTVSILKDAVDYYVEFRPYEHYPIGIYIFIPDDTDPEIGFYRKSPENPFKDDNFDDVFKQGKLWMIVGRDDAVEFVRYQVLQCNWDFKWVCWYHGANRVMNIYGMNRVANSYTAGVWTAMYATELDTVSQRWIPDTYQLYGYNGLKRFELADTRYVALEQRMMVTTNKIHPQCWKTTKIVEIEPVGILKLTMKRDEFDPKRDNVELGLCDYYSDTGETEPDMTEIVRPDHTLSLRLVWAKMNEDGYLEEETDINNQKLKIGYDSYFICDVDGTDTQEMTLNWSVVYSDINIDASELSEDEKGRLCRLISIASVGENKFSVKPGKANSLTGRIFTFCVWESKGIAKASIDMEVLKR